MIDRFAALSAALFVSVPIVAQAQPATVDHLALHVANPEASAAFYRELFGMSPLPTELQGTRWLSAGAFELHLIGGRTAPVATPREVHLALRVTNIEATAAALGARGMTWQNFRGDPGKIQTRPDGVRQLFFRDPDGYWIEVNQLPERK